MTKYVNLTGCEKQSTMIKEQIIEVIENSFNEYKGSNEAIDNAAFYIAAEFEKNEKKAVEFLEWVGKDGYPCLSKQNKGLWVLHPQDVKDYTPKELYELFKKEKNV